MKRAMPAVVVAAVVVAVVSGCSIAEPDDEPPAVTPSPSHSSDDAAMRECVLTLWGYDVVASEAAARRSCEKSRETLGVESFVDRWTTPD